MIQLEEPNDIRQLIREWISEACEKKRLPFDQGGTIVQLLNVWLRSYEIEKISNLEERIEALEQNKVIKK
jgi:hypothetical protein